MVHQHERHHGFGNRRGSDADTGIVAAIGFDSCRLAQLIDRTTWNSNTRRGLNANRNDDILPG